MRLALIKYKAEDKCYIPHKSDSTIKVLYKYFQDHGSNYEKLQTIYYMGSTYRDMKDYPASIIWYEKGVEFAETNTLDKKDSMELCLIYSQMADVMYKIGKGQEGLQYEIDSYKIKTNLEKPSFVTNEDMGRFYDYVGKKDSAAKFYQMALMEIVNERKSEEFIDYLGEQLGFYVSSGMNQNAKLVFTFINECKRPYKQSNVYTAIASYYNKKNMPDSALKYTLDALKVEKRTNIRANLSKEIARILSDKGEILPAYKYAMLSLELSDSAEEEANANGVFNARNQMILAELQNNRTFKKEAKQRKIIYSAIFIIIVLLLVSATLLLLVINSRRKIKYQLELQRLSNEKDKISTDDLAFRKKVMTDRQLRAESAPDITIVIKNLQDLADSQKLKLRPDSWELVFNAVDKLHPDFRERLLSYNQDLKNKDIILLYLMKLGFKQADISRIIKRNPSVVSRRLKHIEDSLGISVKEALRGKH